VNPSVWQSMQTFEGVVPDEWQAMHLAGDGWFVVGVEWIVARFVLWQPAAVQPLAATVWVASAAVAVGWGVGVLSGVGSWPGFVALMWQSEQTAVVAGPALSPWHAAHLGPPLTWWIVTTLELWHWVDTQLLGTGLCAATLRWMSMAGVGTTWQLVVPHATVRAWPGWWQMQPGVVCPALTTEWMAATSMLVWQPGPVHELVPSCTAPRAPLTYLACSVAGVPLWQPVLPQVSVGVLPTPWHAPQPGAV
jgi:hypothetical protein